MLLCDLDFELLYVLTLLLIIFLKDLERILHRADKIHRQQHPRASRIAYSAVDVRLIRIHIGILTGWRNVESYFFA